MKPRDIVNILNGLPPNLELGKDGDDFFEKIKDVIKDRAINNFLYKIGDEVEIGINNFNGEIRQAKYVGIRDVKPLECAHHAVCYIFLDEKGEDWSFVLDYGGRLVSLYYYFRPGHPTGRTYVIRPKVIKPML